MLKKIIGKLVVHIRSGWTQYPALITLSAINCIMLWVMERSILEGDDSKVILIASLKTGLMIMPVVFALEYLNAYRRKFFFMALGPAVVLVAVLWLSQYYMPREGVYESYYIFSSTLLALSIASVVPILLKVSRLDYWRYLQTLVVTFATSIIYVSIAFLALVLALQALEYLFGVRDTWVGIYDIASLCYTWLHTLVFVALFTLKARPGKEEEMIWPFLKTLAQAVFLPIASLYMIILYAYAVRILLIGEWPRGWITNLVFGLAIIGLGTFAILYPYLISSKSDVEDSAAPPWWVRWFNKYFFALMVPLSLLQLLSIGVRISSYGWTIPRYVVVLIGVYILATCLYLIFSERRDLRVLAIGLFSFFLMGAFSPWNALRVSKHSIRSIITEYLVQMDPDGHGLLPAKDRSVSVLDSTANILAEKLTYMMYEYGPKTLVPFLPEDCKELFASTMENNLRVGQGALLRDLSLCTSIDFVAAQENVNVQANQYFYLSGSSYNTVLRTDVSGFKYSYRFYVTQKMDNTEMSLSKDSLNLLSIRRSDNTMVKVDLNAWVKLFPSDLTEVYELDPARQVWDTRSVEGTPIRIVLHRVEGYYSYGDIIISEVEGVLYE